MIKSRSQLMRASLRLLTLAALSQCGLQPQASAAPSQPLTCTDLRPRMLASHVPDLALAAFHHGKLNTIFCTTSSTPLSPDAIFEAASLSKPVFAAGVLQLVQGGKLELDRPLVHYLKDGYTHQQQPLSAGVTDHVTDPRVSRVSARMVLTHTAGLPNWSHRGPLTFLSEPGNRWSYSGEGYVLLQRVVEAITGEPLDRFLAHTVLATLGMQHSSFVWQPEFARTALDGHTASGEPEPIQQFSKPLAPSTLYTTLADYARFVAALLRAQPGSAFAMEESPQVTVRADLHLGWALGLAVDQGLPLGIFHWGANPGFQSFFFCQPRTGDAVLYLTDSDNGLDLLDPIVQRTVPGRHPALRFPMLHPKD